MPNLSQFRQKAKNMLFIDIETVSAVGAFDQLDERMQEQWVRKAGNIRNDENLIPYDLFFKKAAIYAEFGKIVCIGVGGVYWNQADEPSLKVKAIMGNDERQILLEFKELLEKYPNDKLVLCAHNGKEFDYPYLCRRMLVNDIEIPRGLQIAGKKPWEILHQDTMDFWRFGDYKNFTQLDLLAALFHIPTSKSDISGEDVTRVYYVEQDLARIARYCKEDIVVLTQLYLRLQNYPLIATENILRAE